MGGLIMLRNGHRGLFKNSKIWKKVDYSSWQIFFMKFGFQL